MTPARLRGTTVELTEVRDEDTAQLFDWINDRSLVLSSAGYAPVHEADHRTWFDAVRGQRDAVIFAIRELDGGAMIGTCQLVDIDPRHRTAELRIRIGVADARGRGFGTEAVGLLLSHAFSDLDLHRVELHVFADNEAALRAYEKAGFLREGTLREKAYIDGRRVDVILMSVLRERD